MSETGTHGLTLNGIDLIRSGDFSSLFWFDVLADGTTWGNAEAVVATIQSQLQDGDLSRTTRYGNRTVSLRVRVYGRDGAALADGEAALRKAARLRNGEVVFTPPQEKSVPTVFDVVRGEVYWEFNDLDEELHGYSQWRVELECRPFARTPWPVTVAAVDIETPPLPDVVVADGSTINGWTAEGKASPPVAGGGEVHTSWTGAGQGVVGLRFTGTFPSRRYVRVNGHRYGYHGTLSARGLTDGGFVDLSIVSATGAAGGGYGDADWEILAAVPVGITLDALIVQSVGSDYGGMSVSEIVATDTSPWATTPRQQTGLIPVYGTERAEASLRVWVEEPGEVLNDTLVYTATPTGTPFAGPLRAYRTSGPAPTPDATMVSGSWNTLWTDEGSADTFTIPASDLLPGTYAFVARLAAVSAADSLSRGLFWSADTNVGPWDGMRRHEGSIRLDLSIDYDTRVLGAMTLPTRRVEPGTDGDVVVKLWQATGDESLVNIDEAWLLRIADELGDPCGYVSIVAAWSGTDLRVNAATPARPEPHYLLAAGDSSTMVDAGRWVEKFAHHRIEPDQTFVLVVTAGTEHAQVEATYYPRFAGRAQALPPEALP